jgi:hypothetical protein
VDATHVHALFRKADELSHLSISAAIGVLRGEIVVANVPVARPVSYMSTVEEIKTAISKLWLEERAELTAELCAWPDDGWDLQMKTDAAAGKFAPLNLEAQAARTAGRTVPLDDIFHEP